MNSNELKKVLESHRKYLNHEDGGARANLRLVDLSGADLRWVDLRGADLSGVYLRWADLRGADLSGAVLRGADLRNCTRNGKQIKTFQSGKYTINLTADIIQIGCINHSIEGWFNFGDEDIESMDDGALEWWRMWKPILKQIIEASPAEK